MRARPYLLASALWLTACGGSAPASAAPTDWLNQLQPFVNRPAPAYLPPHPTPLPFPTGAPLCRADQLRVTGSPGGVGAGNIRYEVDFTNMSPSPCQLSGRPQMQGLDPGGQLVTVPVSIGTYFVDPIPADIAPGESGYLNIGTVNEGNCPGAPAPVTYTKLRFGLPGGGWIPTGISATRACGILSVSGLGKRPGPEVEPSASPGSAGTLQASLEGFPEQAQTGTTMHFIVVLTNPSAFAVSLSPCPSFTEVINPSTPVARSLYLNCDHVTVIPPAARVRYAMELAIPRQARPGPAKWGWMMNVPYPQPTLGGVLTLQG